MAINDIEPTDHQKNKFVYSETVNLDEADRSAYDHPGFSTQNSPTTNKDFNYPEEDRVNWEGAGF